MVPAVVSKSNKMKMPQVETAGIVMTQHAGPPYPTLHVQVPDPLIPSSQVPFPQHGLHAPPGQGSQLGPNKPDRQSSHATPTKPELHVH